MEWIRVFENEAEARQRIQSAKPQLLILNGKRICLSLFEDHFYAIQDSCPHNGESLSKGRINYLGEIICPWHGYRFDLQTGMARDSSCSDLHLFPVKIDQSGFYVGIM
jgi:nitrite reductase/ring-hydroxylating ferredoxin subunit